MIFNIEISNGYICEHDRNHWLHLHAQKMINVSCQKKKSLTILSKNVAMLNFRRVLLSFDKIRRVL